LLKLVSKIKHQYQKSSVTYIFVFGSSGLDRMQRVNYIIIIVDFYII